MASRQFNQVGYGLTQPLVNIFPAPIVSKRAPLVTDHAQIGTLWIDSPVDQAYILTAIVSNQANWILLESSGGSGFFSSLTVTPGPTSLTGAFTVIAGTNAVSIGADAANHSVTIGSMTGGSLLDLRGGTNGAVLETAATGIITIGATNMTANLQVGNSSTGQAISIGGNTVTGTQTINIGNAASGSGKDLISIGNMNGASSLTLEAGTIGILVETADSGPIVVGSSSMTANIQIGNALVGQAIAIGGAANTGAQTIVIGNNASGAGTNVITIGSTANASHTTLQGGTAGITLTAPFVALPGPVYIYTGAGAPGAPLALHVGDLYINTTAASAVTRMYIATAAGVWTNITCAA